MTQDEANSSLVGCTMPTSKIINAPPFTLGTKLGKMNVTSGHVTGTFLDGLNDEA